MPARHVALFPVALLCLFGTMPTALYAQVTTGGTVTGTVQDPSKAVIPGAELTLTSQATNVARTTVTSQAGLYVFPGVAAGDYALRCSAKGFKTAEVKQLHVEVLKTLTIDLSLELGVAAQVVEVTAGGRAELQTTDATVGMVIGGDALKYLPAQARSITALVLLQPAVAPSICGNRCESGGDDLNGGLVAGALADQSTFYVDGGDATSDLEGTNNYVSPPGEPQPAPFIAVPAESVQEFRAVTASQVASFSRSQGAEIGIVTKSGTNSLHGSLYEYYYGNALRGNDWILNSIGKPQHHSVNNRFGSSAGGPILKDKLFIFGNYEGRRFYSPTLITTAVPTATARMGILQFQDCALGFGANGNCLGGNVISYSLNPTQLGGISTACSGVSAGVQTTCDPRNIGVDSLILNYLAPLPPPNNFTVGDGLNSAGFTASYAQPVIEDLVVAKIDYNISPKWSFFTTYHYNRYRLTTSQQFSVTTQSLISTTPVEPRLVTFQLTGQIGPHFTSQSHGSFMRDWWGWNRAPFVPQVPGTSGVLSVSGEARTASGFASGKLWADPINFDTLSARSRLWFGRDWFAAHDSTWVRGTHTLQFGGAYWFWNLIHSRNDEVTGGLTLGPAYFVGEARPPSVTGGAFLVIPSADRPPTCAPATATTAAVTTNCLLPNDLTRWNVGYASLLGLVDRAGQLGTRNGDFIANPLGAPLIDHVHTHTFDTYVMDTWKVKPSITLTYGLSYGVQFPPHELNGKQVMQVFAANNQPLSNLRAFFAARNAALSTGGFFASSDNFTTDSTFGFSPIRHIPGRSSSATTSWNNFGPRIAVAWNLPFNNKIFGNKQTVIRAGYSILWNRTSAVGEVLTPLLGNGLASLDQCAGPTFTVSQGNLPARCSGGPTNPSNGYRIGVDGSTVPIPPFPNAPIPLVSPGFISVRQAIVADPNLSTPYSHNVSFDIQRAFKGNWLVDVGYIGRFSRNIWTNADINAADPFAKDPTSGQTLAQAFDALSLQARAGTLVDSMGNFIGTPQPFFENPTYGCAGCTAAAAAGDVVDLINGSLSGFMLFNYELGGGVGQARPMDPMQFIVDNMTTDGARANYNAMFISVRKATPSWTMTANYTWSHSIANVAGLGNYAGQNYTFYSPPTPFDFNTGTASANGDRRHVFNLSWHYLLPFGRGRRFATGNSVWDRIIGGWYSSGIWTWETGLPTCILADGDYGSVTGGTCAVGASLFGKADRHDRILGSGGIGTATTTGINLFADPAAVHNSLSRPLLSQNRRPVQEELNLPRSWNVDLSFGKNILVTERYKVIFAADFFNVFNHPIFCIIPFGPVGSCTANLDLSSGAAFGVAPGPDNAPRQIQLGIRFEF